MSNPHQNNGNMNLSEANMINAQNNNNLYIPVQSPVYAVPITAQGNPMGMPNKGQVTTPMAIPVATQGQPVIVQTQQNDNNQKVIVIQEENNQKDKGRPGDCVRKGTDSKLELTRIHYSVPIMLATLVCLTRIL